MNWLARLDGTPILILQWEYVSTYTQFYKYHIHKHTACSHTSPSVMSIELQFAKRNPMFLPNRQTVMLHEYGIDIMFTMLNFLPYTMLHERMMQ